MWYLSEEPPTWLEWELHEWRCFWDSCAKNCLKLSMWLPYLPLPHHSPSHTKTLKEILCHMEAESCTGPGRRCCLLRYCLKKFLCTDCQPVILSRESCQFLQQTLGNFCTHQCLVFREAGVALAVYRVSLSWGCDCALSHHDSPV